MRYRLLITALLAVLSAAQLHGCVSGGALPVGGSPGAESTSTVSVGESTLVRAVVVRHTDGDTAHFLLPSGVEEKVRFIGMNTPEVFGHAEPFGKQASQYTARAIPIGATVWLETDAELRDRYGRLLAYVWLEKPVRRDAAEAREKMLNARLVADGYASVYTFPPNVKYVEVFIAAQREAREANRGLWGK